MKKINSNINYGVFIIKFNNKFKSSGVWENEDVYLKKAKGFLYCLFLLKVEKIKLCKGQCKLLSSLDKTSSDLVLDLYKQWEHIMVISKVFNDDKYYYVSNLTTKAKIKSKLFCSVKADIKCYSDFHQHIEQYLTVPICKFKKTDVVLDHARSINKYSIEEIDKLKEKIELIMNKGGILDAEDLKNHIINKKELNDFKGFATLLDDTKEGDKGIIKIYSVIENSEVTLIGEFLFNFLWNLRMIMNF